MPRLIDVRRLQVDAVEEVFDMLDRYEDATETIDDYDLQRWIAQMSAVELNGTWERYVERRLVAQLNRKPAHFIKANDIRGITAITSGLAVYIIRGGRSYFDFRGSGDLKGKIKAWFSEADNPFQELDDDAWGYIDTLAATRNCIVHGSDVSIDRYRKMLRVVYGMRLIPSPSEFLNAQDQRANSPARRKPRLLGLAEVIMQAIEQT